MTDTEYAEFLAQAKPCEACLQQASNLCNGVITKVSNSKLEKLICNKVKLQQASITLEDRLKHSLIPTKMLNSVTTPIREYKESYYDNLDIKETPDVVAWVLNKMKTEGATGVVLTKPWLDYAGITYVDTPLVSRTLVKDYLVVIHPSKFLSKKHIAMIRTRKSSIIGRPNQTFIIGESIE